MSRYAAPRAGALPTTDGTTVAVAGLALPPGAPIACDPAFGAPGATATPVAWVTREPTPDVATLWRDLAARFADTGLWPLVMTDLPRSAGRPWLSGELAPSRATDPRHFDAAAVLDEKWRWVIPVPTERPEAMLPLHPFTREFPGLAPPTAGDDAPLTTTDLAAGRLGLVAVQRPADVVATLGWMGATNYDLDMGALAAVLRSWEDRFGAYVLAIGFDTLTLGVQRPPASMHHTLAIAAEHFAICSDIVYQGAGSLEAYADDLVGQPRWTFWWD